MLIAQVVSMISQLQIRVKPLEVEETPKVQMVREAFGLEAQRGSRTIVDKVDVPTEGITYVSGPSGSGKSSILKYLINRFPEAVGVNFDFDPELSVVDHFDGPLSEVLRWLSSFGLGEAMVFQSSPRVLSEGQRYRLALSLAAWKRPRLMIVDEFLSVLDRVTAKVVAFQFQKLCRRHGMSVVCATAHDDLYHSLRPDSFVRLGLDGQAETLRRKWRTSKPAPFRFRVESAGVKDYEELSHFHYAKAYDRRICWEDMLVQGRRVMWRKHIAGVSLYTRPYARELEKIESIKKINHTILLSERTVVHPTFRGLGLTSLLDPVVQNKPHSSSAYRYLVSMSALGKYFPFRLGSGFSKVTGPRISNNFVERELELVKWYCGLIGTTPTNIELEVLRRVFSFASEVAMTSWSYEKEFSVQTFVKELTKL